MVKISLHNLGKRFNKEWIFRDVSIDFSSPESYALLGANGSGKSTLLQIISGFQIPSSGDLKFFFDGEETSPRTVFKKVAVSAPYLELIEEFTLLEMAEFHFQFKNLLPGFSVRDILEIARLENHLNKPVKLFSSGMKQKLKLALSVFSDTPILLLDEPCTNLDQDGIDWYRKIISDHAKNRLVIVASNQSAEYDFCTHKIRVTDYKPVKVNREILT